MNYNIYIRFPPAATFVVLDLSVYINATYIFISPFAILILYTHYTSKKKWKKSSYFLKIYFGAAFCIFNTYINKMVILVTIIYT